MAQRDRNGNSPSARQDTQSDDQPRRNPPAERTGAGRPREESFAPWDVEPAEVDRYLAGRADAPPSRQSSRTRPGAEPRTGSSGQRRRAEESEQERRPSGDPNLPTVSRAQQSDEPGQAEPWDAAELSWTDEPTPEDLGSSTNDIGTPPPRRTRQGSRQRTRARRPARPTRQMPPLRVPGFVARADLTNDSTALGLLAVAGFSVAVMVAVMSNRLDALPDSIAIHLNAGGLPDRWGEPQVLWRLPLLATMITLINLTLAWVVSPHDRFASRFLLGGAVVVQFLTWIAAIQFLW